MERCGICDRTDKPLTVCSDCHVKTTGEMQDQIDALEKEIAKLKKMLAREVDTSGDLRKQCVRLSLQGRKAFYG